MNNETTIHIEVRVNAPVGKVWDAWTKPEHIIHWNFASDDWHCPSATNDLREGGKFSSRMEAKDGSMGFDFWGTYTKVIPQQVLEYDLGDGRTVSVVLEQEGEVTVLKESFQTEDTHTAEQQRYGWQCILDNFKAYIEK